MKGVLIACGLLASSVSGHVQMSNPYPIRSPLDPNGDESKKDYSYTNPLSSSGSDFPCKGYANDPFRSVATYSPGGEYDLELQGSATHDGGSCQVSLSYDKGSNFQVIHSMLGGCPLTESYKFTIPSDAPTGEALLTWTWFNKVGNREMYMNCAQVTIGDSDDSHSAKQKRDSFSSLPPIFIANVNGPGQCTTIEGYDVNFPLPGPSVEGSVSGTGYNCTGTAPFLGSGSSGSTHSAVSSSPSGHSTAPTTSASTGSKSKSGTTAATPVSSSANAPAMVASSFGSQSARLMSLPTAASADDTDRFTPGKPCVDGTIICGPQGTTWSLCSNGRPVHMGAVAAGTYCAHGEIQSLF